MFIDIILKYMYIMSTVTAIAAVCEEFTDTILVDKKKNSVIVNVKKQWFATLNRRLLSMKCKLVHKTPMSTGYTCTYVYSE
jgi:hypothetical protein